MRASAPPRRHRVLRQLLVGLALPVLVAWAGALYLGATRGLAFLGHTSWSLDAPPGSPSRVGRQIVRGFFSSGQHAVRSPLSQAVLVTARRPSDTEYDVLHPVVRAFTQRLADATLGDCGDDIRLPPEKLRLCWWQGMHGVFAPDADAYYPHFDKPLGPARTPAAEDVDVWRDLISPDNKTSTMLLFDIAWGFGGAGNPRQVAAWDKLTSFLDAWSSEPLTSDAADADVVVGGGAPLTNGDLYEVGTTHIQMLLDAAQKGVALEFEHGDMITLPIAWFILVLATGPPAVLVLVTLPSTLLFAFWVLDQIATGNLLGVVVNGVVQPRVNFPSFVPAVFVNIGLAISLDYALFMLKRYREEVRKGKPNLEAVRISLSRAGRVIFVSGTTLGLTCAGLTFSSVNVVASIGWGGALMCAIAVLVHLTLLPALLVLCGACCRPLAARRCTTTTLATTGMRCCGCCCTEPTRGGGIKGGSIVRAVSAGDLERMLMPGDDKDDGGDDHHHRRRPQFETTSSTSVNGHDGRAGRRRHSSTFVRFKPTSSFWIRLGIFCRDHRKAIVAVHAVILCFFFYGASQWQETTSQALVTPRATPALKTLTQIQENGMNAALMNPVTIVAYNHWDHGSRPGGSYLVGPAASQALDPRCHDDNTDLRSILHSMTNVSALVGGGDIPPRDLTCGALDVFTAGAFCDPAKADQLPHIAGITQDQIVAVATAFCRGTCVQHCDAAGWGLANETARLHANRTVLVPTLFQQTARLRARLLADPNLGLAPSDVRDITTVPLSDAPVESVDEAFRLLQDKNSAAGAAYRARFQRLTNYNGSAVFMQIVTPMAQSMGGDTMVARIRDVLQQEAPWADSAHGFVMVGDFQVLLDSVALVFEESPPITAGVALVVIFVMAGLAFRSLLIPVRLLFTVVVTVRFCDFVVLY